MTTNSQLSTLNKLVETLEKLIGRRGQIFVERNKLAIEVQIVDARSAYGRQEVMVQPTSGLGTTWVSLGRVKLQEAALDELVKIAQENDMGYSK